MEELYSKKNISATSGPSDLTIKRILAFSKALQESKTTPSDNKPTLKEE